MMILTQRRRTLKTQLKYVLIAVSLSACSDRVVGPSDAVVPNLNTATAGDWRCDWVPDTVRIYAKTVPYCEWWDWRWEDAQGGYVFTSCHRDDAWCVAPESGPPVDVIDDWSGGDDTGFDCHSAYPRPCNLDVPNPSQRERIRSEIAKISEVNEVCLLIKAKALELFNADSIPHQPGGHPDGYRGGFLIWSDSMVVQDRYGNDQTLHADAFWVNMGPNYPTGMEQIHLWDKALHVKIIVHEVLHLGVVVDGVKYSAQHEPPYQTPDGRRMSEWVRTCTTG